MSQESPRLLIVARDAFPPFRVDVVDLFSYYLSKKIDITWLMQSGAQSPLKPPPPNGSEFFRVYGRGSNPFGSVCKALHAHFITLLEILRGRYEIVQCRDVLMTAPLYAIAAKVRGKKFCYWMSYPMSEGYILSGYISFSSKRYLNGIFRLFYGIAMKVILYHFVYRLADVVFVQSDTMKSDVVGYGISDDRVVSVPMGINDQRYGDREDLTPHRYPTRPTILYVGTLDEARRMEVPAAGVAMYLLDNPTAVFMLIGKSSQHEKDRVLTAAHKFGVADRFIFLNHMPLTDLFAYIKGADVCLAPYPSEPALLASASPTKLVEYIYLGGQVVANRHPDQKFVIEMSGAGILTDFEPESFRNGIQKAVEHPDSPDIRRIASQWIRANRSYLVLSDRVAAVYANLLSGGLIKKAVLRK